MIITNKEMKRVLLSLALILLPIAVHAAGEIEIDGIYYNLDLNNKTAEVVFHSDYYYQGEVVIPLSVTFEEVNYSVIGILENAFKWSTELTSVTMPNSITKIAEDAFAHCRNLKSINMSENIVNIGEGAFSGCINLTSITIPSKVTNIGTSTFNGCKALEKVIINSNAIVSKNYIMNTTSISSYFASSKADLEYILGDEITSIGDYAFDWSKAIEINIPKNVISIGEGAFRECSNITSVNIPRSVKSIGNNAFYNCHELVSIEVENGNLEYDSRGNCNALIKTADNTLLLGCKNTIIPNNITAIGDNAFYNCWGISILIIPNSLKNIGNQAFIGCSNLTDIYCYAEQVPEMGSNVFSSFFYDYFQKTKLHVPAGSLEAYCNAEQWKEFKEIVALTDDDPKPTGIKDINNDSITTGRYYSLNGQQMATPRRGLNIILMKDGTTKKVIVK